MCVFSHVDLHVRKQITHKTEKIDIVVRSRFVFGSYPFCGFLKYTSTTFYQILTICDHIFIPFDTKYDVKCVL
jgi:hypothetical protein